MTLKLCPLCQSQTWIATAAVATCLRCHVQFDLRTGELRQAVA